MKLTGTFVTSLSSIAMSTSLDSTPAFSAGESGSTDSMSGYFTQSKRSRPSLSREDLASPEK